MLTVKTQANNSKTILIVEDSATQAMCLQTLLEQEGLQVMCAGNGRAGIQLARQLKPDLIVLDVQMPEMDGFEVCQCLKASCETAEIPIIMLTRHDDPQAVQMGLVTGALDYIPKDDFANAVLLETLRQMGIIEP